MSLNLSLKIIPNPIKSTFDRIFNFGLNCLLIPNYQNLQLTPLTLELLSIWSFCQDSLLNIPKLHCFLQKKKKKKKSIKKHRLGYLTVYS